MVQEDAAGLDRAIPKRFLRTKQPCAQGLDCVEGRFSDQAMTVFPLYRSDEVFSDKVQALSVLGTLHNHRWRWNPFDAHNDLTWNADLNSWMRTFFLSPTGGRHGDGIYVFRFVVNHNPRRVLKADLLGDQIHGIHLYTSSDGREGGNIAIKVLRHQEIQLRVGASIESFSIETPHAESVQRIVGGKSYELNGFVWDEADMFEKFDETLAGRSFQEVSPGQWEIDVDLRRDGGIDFRHDGVYQFLISSNKDEDQGLSALNGSVTANGSRVQLVHGTGFGSSHGLCLHSAPTVRVNASGRYRLTLHIQPGETSLEVRSLGIGEIRFLNRVDTLHLLGTVHPENPFDPTAIHTLMRAGENDPLSDCHSITCDLQPGTYSINFGLGRELFLDTMALGCWLEPGPNGELQGMGWHGKPNESNIAIVVNLPGRVTFTYDRSTDRFSLAHACGSGALQAVKGLRELSLVGSFDAPLVPWNPKDPHNLMQPLGDSRYERMVWLQAGRKYEYKYVANRTDWLLVFADYELDGYGFAYDAPLNPTPFDTSLEQLRQYGHLTTHGNPPALQFTPKQEGWHRFTADLVTGGYSVQQLKLEQD